MVAIVDREGCIGCTLCTGAHRAGKRRRRCSGQLPGVGHPAGVNKKAALPPERERRRSLI